MSKITAEHGLDPSPKVSDEVRCTTCYMCACRCGILVHLRDGKVRYIEGNRKHPINRGVICAKGAAGIMNHYAPSRLSKPLLRVGERGKGEFREIEWEEAFAVAVSWLKPLRDNDPRQLAFFTGRDQSQSFTGWWAQQFGTPNYAAHGGFCSVNMAAAGIYTIGGSFWEFGQPDWELTKMFMIFGVAEDHDSNPLKLGLGRLKERGVKVVAVNPVRTGYSAIADEWVPVTPGTDGLFILALVHELLRSGAVDVDYLLRYTNAAWLVVQNEGQADHGLFARNATGRPLVWDRVLHGAVAEDAAGATPALKGEVTLDDGRRAVPVFELMARTYLDARYAPDNVAAETGIAAAQIRRLAGELARVAFDEEIVLAQPWTDMKGQRHETMIGRPVSFHAMRGISAHANGFQTCRALHLLQILLGSIDCPGGFRFKPPYPKSLEAHPVPSSASTPNQPLRGPHLGYPRGPEDLALDAAGRPIRIDKAFSWEAPLSPHGLMHMVIANAHAGDPYPIEVLFLYMANMAWNSSMNTEGVIAMLEAKKDDGSYVIPKIIYSDAYASEMVAYADLIFPDTTYLERHDCISLLDRPICEPDAAADAIRWPVVEPDRDVRPFQTVLLELGVRLGLPGLTDAEGKARYSDYADYIVNHLRRPDVGPLAGFRGEKGERSGRGRPNPEQIERYIENGGFWQKAVPADARYFKHANASYQDWAVDMGFFDGPMPVTFQLYLEPLAKFQRAAEGFGALVPPEHLRERMRRTFDPLPIWYPPFEEEALTANGSLDGFPLHAITQRPAAMYHSWGSQNAWLRQIHGRDPLFVPGGVCDELGLKDGDWAQVISHHGRITVPIARMDAVNSRTVWTWNAIGKRKGAWALKPDAQETTRGFLLNHLIHELLPPKGDGLRWANSDPITGQAAWYDLRVRLEKAERPADGCQPNLSATGSPVAWGPDEVAFGKEWCR